MTSAPTSAAYPSPPVASPPVTVACDPISAMRPLEPAVVHGDRGALSGLSRRADAEDLVTEEVLLADNSEAKALERLLHLLERLANQVVGDLCHRRSCETETLTVPPGATIAPAAGDCATMTPCGLSLDTFVDCRWMLFVLAHCWIVPMSSPVRGGSVRPVTTSM